MCRDTGCTFQLFITNWIFSEFECLLVCAVFLADEECDVITADLIVDEIEVLWFCMNFLLGHFIHPSFLSLRFCTSSRSCASRTHSTIILCVVTLSSFQ